MVQTVASLFFADRFDAWVRTRFPDPPTIRMKILGVGEVVATGDPAVVKALFTAPPGSVAAGEINRRVLPILGADSVMTVDGERHLKLRRLLLPPFHGDAIREYESAIERIAAAEVESWPLGSELSLHPRMQAIALEVILEVVLGASDPARRERLRAVLPKVLQANPISILMEDRMPWLYSGAIGRMRPWIRTRQEADRLLRDELAAHRASPDGREDILAMLIASRDEDGQGLSDAELGDQLLTLLLAGHETTATSLAWCFERLTRHPAALARVREDIAAGRDEYLDATIKETMRMRPVIEAVWRLLKQPLEVGDYRLPAGTVVAPVLRDTGGAEAFEDPEDFRPERFLEDDIPSYSQIPFGGGPRRCIGASFATMEMKIVLRTVLSRVELRAADPAPEKVDRMRRFTASPRRGARVAVAYYIS